MAISKVEFSKGAKTASPKALRRISAAMKRDGAVSFGGLFSMTLLRKLRQNVLRRHGSGELRKHGLVRDIGGRYAALLPFDGPFLDRKFYGNPALRAILETLLGPDYCIGSLETVVAMPGANKQHQHIDGPIRFDRSAGGKKKRFKGEFADLPPYAVTLCVPLCDVDESNGPTAVWPGSHRVSLRAKPPGIREIVREFPEAHMTGAFGRAFLFDYRTFHCGMPNMTPEPRPVLMFVFTRSWFRDPNLADVYPRVVIKKRDLERVLARDRGLFMLAPAARRRLWPQR